MTDNRIKRVSDSFTTQVQMLTLSDLNGYHRLFGGKLMSWMDIVAGVTARRHSERNVTTVSVEKLEFHAPAHANDILVLTGHVCYVGRTSMDICVNVYIEEIPGNRKLINEAHFTMVALDENEKPAAVPGLLLENDEQRMEWREAEQRRENRKRAVRT